MNLICNSTRGETKCTNRVTIPKSYCHLHKKKNTVLTKKKLILPNINNNNKNKILLPGNKIVINNNSLNNDIIQDCPICLCEIDKDEEDTGLICMHKFHIDCLNHIEKSECPVCRGPLEFVKSSKVDISKIKYKEEQEMLNNKEKQITEDFDLGRSIRNEEENEYNRNHNHNNNRNRNRNRNQIFDMNFFMEQLERAERLEERRQINLAIESSLLSR